MNRIDRLRDQDERVVAASKGVRVLSGLSWPVHVIEAFLARYRRGDAGPQRQPARARLHRLDALLRARGPQPPRLPQVPRARRPAQRVPVTHPIAVGSVDPQYAAEAAWPPPDERPDARPSAASKLASS